MQVLIKLFVRLEGLLGIDQEYQAQGAKEVFVFITHAVLSGEAAKKIKKYAFSGGQATLDEHRKKGGNPDVDVSFQMLLYGMEPNDKKLRILASIISSLSKK